MSFITILLLTVLLDEKLIVLHGLVWQRRNPLNTRARTKKLMLIPAFICHPYHAVKMSHEVQFFFANECP